MVCWFEFDVINEPPASTQVIASLLTYCLGCAMEKLGKLHVKTKQIESHACLTAATLDKLHIPHSLLVTEFLLPCDTVLNPVTAAAAPAEILLLLVILIQL